MSGKEKKAAALEEKLQLLRSVTKSNAANKTSILVDASKYIKELKDKVDEAAAADHDSSCRAAASPGTVISVSSVDLEDGKSSGGGGRRGFRINVSMERSRPGLLVSVLEALEDLGLDILDADVSCADDTPFRLQALGSGHQGDAQMVRQAVVHAISKCMDRDE